MEQGEVSERREESKVVGMIASQATMSTAACREVREGMTAPHMVASEESQGDEGEVQQNRLSARGLRGCCEMQRGKIDHEKRG